MSAASQVLLDAGIEALGWTLLHFLWQGAAAGAIFALLMKVLARASAGLRYAAGLCVFAGLALTPVVTFWYVFDGAPAAGVATAVSQAIVVTGVAGPHWWSSVESMLQALLPWLVLAWFAGVLVLSCRLAREWAEVRALVRSCTRPLPPSWRDAAERLRFGFGIRRPVQVLESALVHVPMVIGWFKPVILIPPAALLGLTTKQLELLVAHELAHIRRLDYAVNLFQVAVETLLFYHPAVRWMSSRIREERELCCDDLVVAKSGDNLAYARALAEMEGLRAAVPCMGMAADGGQLISRINRLVALPAPQRGAAHWLLGILLAAAGTSVMTSLHFAVQSFDVPAASVEPAPATRPEPAAIVESGAPAVFESEPSAAQPRSATVDAPPVAIPREIEPVAVEIPSAPAEEPASAVAPPNPPVDVAPVASASADAAPADVASEKSASATIPSVASAARAPQPAGQPEPDSSPVGIDEPVPAVEEAPPAETSIPEPAISEPANPDSEAAPADGGRAETRLAMLREPAAEPARPVTAALQQETVAPETDPAPGGPVLSGGTPITVTQPGFPRRARLKGIEGAVTVEFTVTRRGRVEDVRIVSANPEGVFDREVADTVREWRFEPYQLDGAPIDRRIARTIQFELDGSAPSAADTDCVIRTGSRLCRGDRIGSQGRAVETIYRAED